MPISAQVQIDIEAPAQVVWAAMVDFERYGEWNPFIVHVETDRLSSPAPEIGDPLVLHVEWVGGEGSQRSGERITAFSPPTETQGGELSYRFTGPMHALGLVRAKRVQRVQVLEDGGCRYSSVEVFRGLLTSALPLAQVQAGFEAHAEALKEWVEGQVQG